MKNGFKILLVLVLVLNLLGCSSQTAQPKDPWVLVHSENGYDAPLDYVYNAEGQLIRKIQEGYDLTTTYTYHENGELYTETVQEGSQDLVMVREYDDHGNLVSEGYPGADGHLEYYTICVNHYDNEGRLTEVIKTAGIIKSILRYSYFDDGRYQIDYTDYDMIGEDQTIFHCQRSALFTEGGRMIEWSETCQDGMIVSNWLQVNLDSRGNPEASTKSLSFSGVPEVTSRIFVNRYDSAQRLTETVTYDASGSPVELYTTRYEYDQQGNRIREVCTYPDGYSTEIAWEYDDHGNLLSRVGLMEMSDVDYFLQGRGDRYLEVADVYQYAPLSQAQQP